MTAPGRRPSSTRGGSKARGPAPVELRSGIFSRSIFNSSDNGFTAPHMHAFGDGDLYDGRHQHVRTRAEFYHPKQFAAFYSLPAPLPTYNAPGEHSGDLNTLNCNVWA